ncbi:PTPLA-domain-containing protein [Coprinopsis marcescibilis]|uniref:Very-long-chain (3R)-3-hydroxyacyl-CoA dehydratase n=1 Tax=Coprinopsis marcescibilis TaxID=230819 RepID=A0A5C3KQD4_COPMA|nr:PTPLA-domain-containing protein [Coprinopsis marcescibilis]
MTNKTASTKATQKPKRATPPAVKYYLVAYNVLSALGWAYLLIMLLIHLFNLDGKSQGPQSKAPVTTLLSRVLSTITLRQPATPPTIQSKLPLFLQPIYSRAATAYSRIGPQTTIIQSFAILEVLHVLLGWVRSPIATTTMQVSSRLFLVWGITQMFPQTHSNPIFTSMVLAWSITEVIRYAFYAYNLLGYTPSVLLWLRYSTFYVLYPIGASSEAFLMLATLPQTSPIPSSLIPWKSTWTIGQYARGALFTIWWPGLYAMISYMIGQRRKIYGPPAPTPKPKSVKTQ